MSILSKQQFFFWHKKQGNHGEHRTSNSQQEKPNTEILKQCESILSAISPVQSNNFPKGSCGAIDWQEEMDNWVEQNPEYSWIRNNDFFMNNLEKLVSASDSFDQNDIQKSITAFFNGLSKSFDETASYNTKAAFRKSVIPAQNADSGIFGRRRYYG